MAHYFLVGKPPDGLVWHHRCHVRHCVNPSHLEAITQSENVRRTKSGYTDRFPVMPKCRPSVDERFWTKVNKTDSCWLWIGGVAGPDYKTGGGYGRFSVNKKLISAHHYLVGPPPDGLVWDHLCRNRLCVRPDHLEAVTQSENVRRSHPRPAKTHCRKGHPYTQTARQKICTVCKRESEVKRMSDPAKRAARRAWERENRAKKSGPKPAKTNCAQGHPWTAENIGYQGRDQTIRYCIPCRKRSAHAAYLRRKVRVAS